MGTSVTRRMQPLWQKPHHKEAQIWTDLVGYVIWWVCESRACWLTLLQCSYLPLLKHCMSFQLLGRELIPSRNRSKGRDAQESHWGLLLPKSDHSCHIDPSPHKTAWHSLRIISFLLQVKLQKKNMKNWDSVFPNHYWRRPVEPNPWLCWCP